MSNRTRSETITIRITPEEKQIFIRKMRETKSRNYADFLMKMICTHHTTNIDTRPLMKISGELNHIGVNVNQLAKAVNTSKNISDLNAAELLKYLKTIYKNIREMREVVRQCLDIFIDAREGKIDGLHEDSTYKV